MCGPRENEFELKTPKDGVKYEHSRHGAFKSDRKSHMENPRKAFLIATFRKNLVQSGQEIFPLKNNMDRDKSKM